MKKKLSEILAVSAIFEALTHKHYTNFSLSFKIARAAKELASQKDFYIGEERKIIELYAQKDENGQVKIVNGNQISFKDQEDALKFNKDINDLANTEVDIFEPLEIKMSDFKEGEMDLTPNDLITLDGFVVFVDEEEGRAVEAN